MKSIKAKIFFVVLSGIVTASAVVGGIGIFWSNKTIKNDASQILDLMSQVQTEGLDSMFLSVEQTTKVLSDYVTENLEYSEIFLNDAKFTKYIERIENISYYIANCTHSVMSVYVHFAPELIDRVSNILWHKVDDNFVLEEMKDVHVGNSNFVNSWFYRARTAGTGIWTKPYYNDDLNEYLISYLLPVFKNGKFIGVVGMDIDFDDIVAIINSIKVYDTGYAFLTDADFTVLYHRRMPYGTKLFEHAGNFKVVKHKDINTDFYEYTSEIRDFRHKNKVKQVKFKMIFQVLANGMNLVVSVPANEIDRTRTRLIYGLILSAVLISIFVSIWCIWMSSKITNPLKKLSDSTKKIVAGNYDFDFDKTPNDEIGELMGRFEFMAKSLKQQFEYINNLAYLDSMTGAKNKRAFIDETDEIDLQIRNSKDSGEKFEFAVIVFDVNNLKYTNDNFGHKAGDQLIKAAFNLITTNFSFSKIFRIGGDEFVATITGRDFENRTELLAKFRTEMDSPLPENNGAFDKVAIASGLAVYDSEKDSCFQNVFERADEEMYKTKISMKGGSENIR